MTVNRTVSLSRRTHAIFSREFRAATNSELKKTVLGTVRDLGGSSRSEWKQLTGKGPDVPEVCFESHSDSSLPGSAVKVLGRM